MNEVSQIVITIITVIGSASAWKFFEKRLYNKMKEKRENRDQSDTIQYRDDLKQRIIRLENSLAASSKEKDELLAKITELYGEVQALRTKVEFLEKENERLKSK